MKKALTFVLMAAALATAAPSLRADTAPSSGDPTIYHRNVPDTPIWRNREFWQAEKERSGLPQFWENTKNFFRGLNPGPRLAEQRERYEARRAAAASDSAIR